MWRARKEFSGLSRERVAALLDPPISAKTVERWEKGSTTPPPAWRLKQLARIYDVPLAELKALLNGDA
jgi:DNA-binding transcriptional regulator YiaG